MCLKFFPLRLPDGSDGPHGGPECFHTTNRPFPPELLYTRRYMPDAPLRSPPMTQMALLAGVSTKTIQDIEQGRSEGTVQTMNRIFGMVGLKLAVVRAPASH